MNQPARKPATYEDLCAVPEDRVAEIFRRQDAQWVLAGSFGGDDTVQAEPFEAVPLELAAIWGSSP